MGAAFAKPLSSPHSLLRKQLHWHGTEILPLQAQASIHLLQQVGHLVGVAVVDQGQNHLLA